MKCLAYTSLILMSLLCPGGCPQYDFDVKPISQPTNDFSNKLKWQAALNAELQEGLLGMNGAKVAHYESDNNGNEDIAPGKDYNDNTDEKVENSALHRSSATKLQRACDGEERTFVGTNLFDTNPKKCFSMEEVALLTARRDFEALLPKELPQCLLNDKMVGVFLHYFKLVNDVIQHMNEDFARGLTEKAFYDTVGGYVKYYLMPVTKYSFYAGKINMRTVDNVAALYQQCKQLLNTNGNGWKRPMKNVLTQLKKVHIEPLRITMMQQQPKKDDNDSCEAKGGNDVEESLYCARLDLSLVLTGAEESQMLLPLPKLEPEDCDGYLGNIWLPFRRKRSFDLRSKKSAFIVVKFYETVSRCYRFQCMCQDAYNTKFRAWISENIYVHLADDQFYPGLGAILRISEKLNRGKKAVTKANEEGGNELVVRESEPTPEKDKTNAVSGWTENKKDEFKEFDEKDDHDHEEEYREIGEGGVFNQKVNCPAKPLTKKKKKKPSATAAGKAAASKAAAKAASKEEKTIDQTPKMPWYSRFYGWLKKHNVLRILCWNLVIIVFILLLLLLFSILRKRRRAAAAQEPEQNKPAPPPSSPPAKKKNRGFCGCFGRKKKPATDDEMLIKPDSSSVVSAGSASTAGTSKKSAKSNKKGKKPGSAKAETSSMGYSSSDFESHSPKSSKHKVVTIDEKKKQKPANSAKKDESKTPRIGIQQKPATGGKNKNKKKKKDSPRSTSWDTTYES